MEIITKVFEMMPGYMWYILGGGIGFILVAIGIRILIKGIAFKYGNGAVEVRSMIKLDEKIETK